MTPVTWLAVHGLLQSDLDVRIVNFCVSDFEISESPRRSSLGTSNLKQRWGLEVTPACRRCDPDDSLSAAGQGASRGSLLPSSLRRGGGTRWQQSQTSRWGRRQLQPRLASTRRLGGSSPTRIRDMMTGRRRCGEGPAGTRGLFCGFPCSFEAAMKTKLPGGGEPGAGTTRISSCHCAAPGSFSPHPSLPRSRS